MCTVKFKSVIKNIFFLFWLILWFSLFCNLSAYSLLVMFALD